MSKRAVVLGLAGPGIPLALLVLVLPITRGYGDYIFGPSAEHLARPQVLFVDPDGPAYRAGLREGDFVVPPRGTQSVQTHYVGLPQATPAPVATSKPQPLSVQPVLLG